MPLCDRRPVPARRCSISREAAREPQNLGIEYVGALHHEHVPGPFDDDGVGVGNFDEGRQVGKREIAS